MSAGRAGIHTLAALAPLVALASLALSACASASEGGRFELYSEPIKQITLRAGRLGWGGVEIGMSLREVQIALGRRLEAPGSRGEPCGFYSEQVAAMRRQKLGLDFDSPSEAARLKAIWLEMQNPKGETSVLALVRALKARFPDLQYVPSSREPLPESANSRPLYRNANGALLLVDARRGVLFGELCGD
ncbi:MAG TPA: hypothetical protein VHR45_05815 [Thermoanaerobaculia bacterium]|nr:hypothetical protein [Thermoanaerobaculia bacterium]